MTSQSSRAQFTDAVISPVGEAVSAAEERRRSGYRRLCVTLSEVRESMWFGPTAEDAYAFWTSTGLSGLLADADDVLRERVLSSLRQLFVNHATPEGILFDSAAWLTTARKR